MRVVIDANRMRKPELMAYLMVSPNNRAVITDYGAIESYKQNDDKGIIDHFKILSSFPGQVIVLKGASTIASLDPRDGQMPEQMVDATQTHSFVDFAAAMTLAHKGSPIILAQIRERRDWARSHLAVMARDIDSEDIMRIVRQIFTKDQWTVFRRREKFSTEMQQRVHAAILLSTEMFAAAHPNGIELPPPPALYSHFTFRLSVCYVVHLMNLSGNGTLRRSKKQSLNDQVDVFQATYATYYNGIMTSDFLVAQTHHDSRSALISLQVPLAENYADRMQDMVVNLIDDRRAKAGKPPLTR